MNHKTTDNSKREFLELGLKNLLEQRAEHTRANNYRNILKAQGTKLGRDARTGIGLGG